MHRWTARFTLLVMLAPFVGPPALAGVDPMQGMHCMRRPLADAPAASPAEPPMHCHHAASQSAEPENSRTADSALSAVPEASFRSLDCCCSDHDCCRTVKTSEWARRASDYDSSIGLLIEPAASAPVTAHVSAVFAGPDSARAPPRR